MAKNSFNDDLYRQYQREVERQKREYEDQLRYRAMNQYYNQNISPVSIFGGGGVVGDAIAITKDANTKVTMNDKKLKIGDKVKFVYNGVQLIARDRIPSNGYGYGSEEGIPPELLQTNGSLVLSPEYDVKFGKITAFHKDWIIVEYPSNINDAPNSSTPGYTKLGFKKENLMPAKGKRGKKVNVIDTKVLDALVIEPIIKNDIIAVLRQHEYQDKLMNKWGLGKVIEYGRGTTFLFHGSPGTGKTYGAKLIAKSLGKELLTIGAAEIQTSEPGGANRNIQNAFKEAKDKNKVLFLDECDSLIFNRSTLGMVLGSEVNTLLTEIEKSEGVVILATNRVSDMDEALERRISLIIEFPFPKLEQRVEIWKGLLPKKLPLDKNVVVAELASHEFTGGFIKNVVLNAARMAVSEKSKKVTNDHFSRAIMRAKASKGIMGKRRIQTEGPSQNLQSEMTKVVDIMSDYKKE